MTRAYLSNMKLSSANEITDIVERSQQGDEEAFHYLFRRYSRPVLTFIYDMLGDRAVSEELTQETFVRAYRGLGNLRDTSKFSTWLFSIAKNIVREAIKEKYSEQRKVGLDEPDSLQIEDERRGPDEELIHAELNDAVKSALLELNEDWRTVFVLKIFNQRSYEEIAEITGYSIGKIKTDLHRARLEMRRKLQSYLS